MMDYLCAKFDYYNFSRFGFIVRSTNTQTHIHTETHTDAAKRLTQANIVGVSKKKLKQKNR